MTLQIDSKNNTVKFPCKDFNWVFRDLSREIRMDLISVEDIRNSFEIELADLESDNPNIFLWVNSAFLSADNIATVIFSPGSFVRFIGLTE